MIRQSQGRVVFQPISLTFGVTVLGGSYDQKYSSDTGEYEPDRSITPLKLVPSLIIDDPDMPSESGDKTGKMINVNWQVTGESNSRKWVAGTDYVFGEDNSLTIYGNLKADSEGKIVLTAQYFDNFRGTVNKMQWEAKLSCRSYTDRKVNIRSLQAQIVQLSPFSPEKTFSVGAQLANGENDITDSAATYKWQVLVGNSFVDLAPSTRDFWYVSGVNSKTLTVRKDYVGNIVVRCVAYPSSMPGEKRYVTVRLKRHYGQYDDSWLWEHGQLKFKDTLYAAGRVVINRRNKGEISNPEKYFDIETFYDNGNGMGWQHVSHTAAGRVDRNMFPVDAAHSDAFGWQTRELTEVQPATINGSIVTMNGAAVMLQIPVTPRE